jgi:ABC-type taurine transport system substrate-binding protein
MAKIDAEDIVKKMLTAAMGVFKEKWPEVQKFAESESKKFAQNMAEIALWKETKEITEEQAKALSRLHQRSMKMVFTALEGISLARAEKAITAALDAIRVTINTAIGWAIL